MDNTTDNFCTFENMEIKFNKLNKLYNRTHRQLKSKAIYTEADLDLLFKINSYLTKFEEKLAQFATSTKLDREDILSIMSMQRINQCLLEKCSQDIYLVRISLKNQQEKGV